MHTQITRQDLFAASALQGLLASGRHTDLSPEQVAKEAAAYAAALHKATTTGAAPKSIMGEHYTVIADAQMVKTSRSEYLELTLEIVDGPHRGLRILDYVHLYDPDVVMRQNALARLAAYCFATGQVQWQGQTEWLRIPFFAEFSQSRGTLYITAIRRSDKQASLSWPKERVELLD